MESGLTLGCIATADAALDFFPMMPFGQPDIVVALQIQPCFRGHTETALPSRDHRERYTTRFR
jgi:hypothetical protein